VFEVLYQKQYFIKKNFSIFNWRKLTVFSSTPHVIKFVTFNYPLYIVSILINYIHVIKLVTRNCPLYIVSILINCK